MLEKFDPPLEMYESGKFTIYVKFNKKKKVHKEIMIMRSELDNAYANINNEENWNFNIKKDDLTITFIKYKNQYYIMNILLEDIFTLELEGFLKDTYICLDKHKLYKFLRPKGTNYDEEKSLKDSMNRFGHDKLYELLKPIKSIHKKNRKSLTLFKNKNLK